MKRLLIAAAFALLAIPAHAGDASCEGKIEVGSEWTTVKNEHEQSFVCRFKTNSTLGKRILRTCPDRTGCSLVMHADANVGGQGRHRDYIVTGDTWTITGLQSVEQE